jgi:hypothetical protein
VIHEATALIQGARHAVSTAGLYAATARRASRARHSADPVALDVSATASPVFVVGSPRSGTTFLAGAIGAAPGFADLTEVGPLKAAIPKLTEVDDAEAAAAVHRILERVRLLARIRSLRAVEQTPEMAFLVPAALTAYPGARVVHIVRDGRDVVTSLLERGWLSRTRAGSDDAGLAYGAHRRFWVDPARAREFEEASDARRAAWAWRTYVEAAAANADERVLEVRYEALVENPAAVASQLETHLAARPGTLAGPLSEAHARSVGRYRSDLSAEQLADVLAEAGGLLERLGYPVDG